MKTRCFILGQRPAVADPFLKDTNLLFEEVGQNTGNLAFAYAINKIIGGAESVLPWHADPAAIAEAGDVGVIPAANQLGSHVDYKNLAERFARFDCKLIMIGLGAQGDLAGNIPSVPEGTIAWIREIAKRSPGQGPNIALRGAYSKRVLDHYGLGEHGVVLGCPSLFINPDPALGQRIAARIKEPRRIAVASVHQSWRHLASIEASLAAMVTATVGSYIGQHALTMVRLTRGEASSLPENELSACRDFACPQMSLDEFVRWTERHGAVFWDVPSWMEHYRRFDFVIGARIHGIMLALQAGIPALCIAHDSRTLELCQTMKVPYVLSKDVASGIQRKDLLSLFRFDPDEFDGNRQMLARGYVEFLESNTLQPADYMKKLAAL